MTISKRVRSQFFTSSSAPAGTTSSPSKAIMASSIETEAPLVADSEPSTLIRLPLTRSIPGKRKRKSRANKSLASQQRKALGWSDEEHDRFLHALELYPTGPWKNVAAFVGTRTTRQVMTHAQKYRQKIERRRRGLQIPVRKSKDAVAPTIATAVNGQAAKKNIVAEPGAAGAVTEFTKADKAISTSASPAATDIMDHWRVCVSGLSESSSFDSFAHGLATTAYGLRLVNDEFHAEAETMWVNQFFVDNRNAATAMHDADDPLALMFQDPSSFSWLESKLLPADTEYSWGSSISHRAVDFSF